MESVRENGQELRGRKEIMLDTRNLILFTEDKSILHICQVNTVSQEANIQAAAGVALHMTTVCVVLV